jgi:hypothetical protein
MYMNCPYKLSSHCEKVAAVRSHEMKVKTITQFCSVNSCRRSIDLRTGRGLPGAPKQVASTASCKAGYSDFEEEGYLNECSRLNISKEGFILDVGCREGDVKGMLPFSSRRKNFSKKVSVDLHVENFPLNWPTLQLLVEKSPKIAAIVDQAREPKVCET